MYVLNAYGMNRQKLHHIRNVKVLVDAVDNKTSCICYFGGDPTPQLPFAIRASRLALEKKKNRILRICWESNGTMNRGAAQ